MNIFYYSAADSICNGSCSYTTCSKRCFSFVRECLSAYEVTILPEGSRLNTPSTMHLRTGDIIILYAKNKREMNWLLTIKDNFDSYRIVLVVGENELIKNGLHHGLKPRFTTVLNNEMNQLSTVLSRMISATSSENKPGFLQQENHHA